MADLTLPRESCSEDRKFNVAGTIFENQASETRLLSSGALLGFRIKSPNLTYEGLKEYLDFYNSKYGSLTSFTFLSPFDGETYMVRFRLGEEIKSDYNAGVFQCEFYLDRVF